MNSGALPKKDNNIIPPPSNPSVEVVSYRVPTEVIDLPSKGLVYPLDSPLSSGTIELKYMTAREEDILTTESYIRKGVVIDKFLNSLIVTPNITVDDLLIGDIDAISLAARIQGYGADYNPKIETPSGNQQTLFINLSELELKELDESVIKEKGTNEFDFELPNSKVKVTFKLLTQKDQNTISDEIKKQEKYNKESTKLSSTQFKNQIVAVDGNYDKKVVYDFVDNGLLAFDARALRKYMESIQPGVNLSMEVVDKETQKPFSASVPFGIHFFWPDAKL